MKKRLSAFVLLCCVLALSACGQKPGDAPQMPEQTTAPVTTQPTDPEPVSRPEVESNGGYFVGVDGKIWFRRFDDDALRESRLWGEFLSARPDGAVASELCFYDVTGNAIMEMFSDDGFGPLWFGFDGFYLTRAEDEDTCEAYFKSLDGTETVLGAGRIAGVSDNGRYAVLVSEREKDWGALCVYEGTTELRSISAQDNGYFEFCALTDDGTLLYLNCADEIRLCEQTANAEEIELGVLPGLPEESYEGAWEFEQSLLDGDELWCMFATYEGTGHFLNDTLCVRSKLGVENGLEVVEDQPISEVPVLPKLYRAAPGEVLRVEHAPGDLTLSEEVCGDLIWHDLLDHETVLVPSFIPDSPYGDEGGRIVQTMETADDAAYLIVADAIRDYEGDIGWRTAFTPGEFYYLRVPLREGSEAETLVGETWNPAVPVSAN